MSEAEQEKYRKNHPDITGMSSGKKDKDEEAMLNDISGGGASDSGDPFDQLDVRTWPPKRPVLHGLRSVGQDGLLDRLPTRPTRSDSDQRADPKVTTRARPLLIEQPLVVAVRHVLHRHTLA